jgi:hypothetical protein
VRLASNPLVMRHAVSPERAWTQAAEWLGSAAAWVPVPAERHAELMAGYLREAWMTSRLVPDAHLAALAVEHGLTLCSTDGDFARFRGLTWHNPLAAPP